VLPLVPPYLCYMAGVSVDDFRGDAGVAARPGARGALLASSIAFILGFSTVFVALGAGASTIGHFLRVWQEQLAFAAGILIIVMGLNFLGILKIPLLSREARFQSEGKPASAVAAYLMGLAFAFGWTPCIGPVLGPILTLAGGRETVGEGAALLAAYSLGLGIPFLIAALFSGAFMRFLQKFRVHLGRVEKVIGGLLVVAGVFFLTGGVQSLSYWLLENFPVLGQLG
jgi:cytochrome c-type biogenesis protein